VDLQQKEKHNIAVILVLEGEVSAKQIENEFAVWIGTYSKWIWKARAQNGNQFLMRFPRVNFFDEISHLKKGFSLSTVDNVIVKIEHWKPTAG
jgi:hypothetical protein